MKMWLMRRQKLCRSIYKIVENGEVEASGDRTKKFTLRHLRKGNMVSICVNGLG